MTDVPAPTDLRRREHVTILAALAGVTAISWLYTWLQARDMAGMDGMGNAGMDAMAGMVMPAAPRPWNAADFALMFIMWWVMMVGMMVPSATPMILTFATINRQKRARGRPFVPTATFVAGYLMAWGVFGLTVTLAQWGLEQAALISPMMKTSSAISGGILFLAAGFLPGHATEVCMPRQVPLSRRFRSEHLARRRGWNHADGPWARVLLSRMLLAPHAAAVCRRRDEPSVGSEEIAAFVFAEKLLPGGQSIARVSGALMLAFGIYLLTQA